MNMDTGHPSPIDSETFRSIIANSLDGFSDIKHLTVLLVMLPLPFNPVQVQRYRTSSRADMLQQIILATC